MPPTRLNTDQLANGIQLCVTNAKALIEEAELLFQNGRYSRAFSLTILAFEEMGKIPMLVRAACYDNRDDDWAKFWKDFVRHKSKHGRSFGAGMLGLSTTQDDEITRFINESDSLKLKGFYVDFDATLNDFRGPSSVIAQQKVKETIDSAKVHWADIEALYGDVDFVKQLLSEIGKA
jgi:AbiV family abortive infection protein